MLRQYTEHFGNMSGDSASAQKMGIALDHPHDGSLCLSRCDSKVIHIPHRGIF